MVRNTRFLKPSRSKLCFVSTILLGIRLDTLPPQTVLDRLRVWFQNTHQHTLFTPNPEMLVKAQTDEYFKKVLNSASLLVCDGKGTALFAPEKVYRFPGVDLMQKICGIAAETGETIFLLGSGSDQVLDRSAAALQLRYPKLRIAGMDKGPVIEETHNEKLTIKNNDELLRAINEAQPTILFVAFGMGKQEKWIYENLEKMPSVKLAMGVGGSFDYISGVVPRAPLLMRKIGLEWAYRLIRQPERLVRIWNATVVFSLLALREKLAINK